MTDTPSNDDRGGPSEQIAGSARGWNGIQLAVLAFVGLCGVLSEADARHPRWLQVTAGLLAVSALALACLAVFLVASVAWPLANRQATVRARDESGPPDVDRSRGARRRLQSGTALTYVAVAVMALAASANWWPVTDASGADSTPDTAQVLITDIQGNAACGELTEGPAGTIRLATARGTVELSLTALATVGPAADC
jgi:hypothetical protein